MVSWNRDPSIENKDLVAMNEATGIHCPAPPFFNIPEEETPWESEMFASYAYDLGSISVPRCNGSVYGVAGGATAVDVCQVGEMSGFVYPSSVHHATVRQPEYRAAYFDATVDQPEYRAANLHATVRQPEYRAAYFDATVDQPEYRAANFHATVDQPKYRAANFHATEPRHSDSLAFSSFGGLFAVIAAVLLSLLSCCIIAGLVSRWCRLRREEQPNEELGRGAMAPRPYRYRELTAATGNFAESERIGRGGFGAVYRGFLNDGAAGRHVAIKALSPESSAQGRKEFEAEVRIISRLRHRNLVQLLGWCDSRKGLFLVYELLAEGSLDKHLHSPDRLLTWTERYKIALDLGSALCYLHTEWEQCVVHSDIKSSNVMLDSSRNAKLGDFGLARLVDHGTEPQTTDVVAGTVGYIDPEILNNRRPSTESDVYSFGVVLLEIACGRRPTPPAGQSNEASTTLLKRVRDMYDRNAILDAADGRMNGEFDERQMERVLVTGLWCAHRDRSRRPSIAQAMSVLRSEDAELPVLPAATHGGSGQIIHFLEGQVYGGLSEERSGSTRPCAATAYHTPEDSSYQYTEE